MCSTTELICVKSQIERALCSKKTAIRARLLLDQIRANYVVSMVNQTETEHERLTTQLVELTAFTGLNVRAMLQGIYYHLATEFVKGELNRSNPIVKASYRLYSLQTNY